MCFTLNQSLHSLTVATSWDCLHITSWVAKGKVHAKFLFRNTKHVSILNVTNIIMSSVANPLAYLSTVVCLAQCVSGFWISVCDTRCDTLCNNAAYQQSDWLPLSSFRKFIQIVRVSRVCARGLFQQGKPVFIFVLSFHLIPFHCSTFCSSVVQFLGLMYSSWPNVFNSTSLGGFLC